MSFAVYHKLSGEKGLYMWFSRYFVYFIIFSCMGWIYESIYCTIRAKKWENRGFLYGPLCPIYGAGGVAITAIADLISAHTDATFKMCIRDRTGTMRSIWHGTKAKVLHLHVHMPEICLI